MADNPMKNIVMWTVSIASVAFILLLLVVIFGNLSGNMGFSNSTTVSSLTSTNESDLTGALAFVNQTGYTLANVNGSNSGYTITAIWRDYNQTSANTTTSNPWNLSGASYDNVNFSTASQDPIPEGIFFNGTGTKMYVLGSGNTSIFQYTLSTAYDVSTATYDNISLNVSTQDITPAGLFFNGTGTKMYVVGNTGDKVYQYSMSQPWNLSNATYDNVNLSITDASSSGLFFNSTGTKMFIIGLGSDLVYQYSMSQPWNLSNATYDNVNFSVASQDTSPQGLFFNGTGTKMFVAGNQNNQIYQYTLSQAWNVSSATNDSAVLNVTNQDATPVDIWFNSTGNRMYISGATNSKVYQYTLSTTSGLATPTGYNVTVASANYSLSAGGVLTNATSYTFPNVSVSYTYSYTTGNTSSNTAEINAENIIGNYTQGAVNTASQFPVVGTILGVAILILVLLALLVFVIVKMSGVSTGKVGAKGGEFSSGGNFG